MIAACFFVLSIFGASLVNANELNVNQLGTAIASNAADLLSDDVNIGANLKQGAQPTLKKTLNTLDNDGLKEVTRSMLDLITVLKTSLSLKTDTSDSSQDISIPASDIAANSKTIAKILTAFQTIVKLNAAVKAKVSTKAYKIANGKLVATKAQSLQALGLLKDLIAQYQALQAALADLKQDLLNFAIAALQDNDNAYAPYLFKNVANAAAATSKAYAAIVASIKNTAAEYTDALGAYTKKNGVALPAATINKVLGALVTNLGSGWDSAADALAILDDKIEASS